MSNRSNDNTNEPRRGSGAEEEAYLQLVGERVRLERVRRGLSRKALSLASGVSERYLAELERGTGNASLLVLRQIAHAIQVRVEDLACESAERSLDLQLAIQQLERLSDIDIGEARRILAARFSRSSDLPKARVALIGMRGAGKSTVGIEAAKALGIPFVELDREIERTSGMEVPEIFEVHGHAVYRKLERDSLGSVLDAYNRVVIATGGGIVTSPESFELLLSSCFVIWLKASASSHVERAGKQGGIAGVAVQPSRVGPAEVSSILEARAPLYAKADAQIDTTDKTPGQVVHELLSLIVDQNLRKTGT